MLQKRPHVCTLTQEIIICVIYNISFYGCLLGIIREECNMYIVNDECLHMILSITRLCLTCCICLCHHLALSPKKNRRIRRCYRECFVTCKSSKFKIYRAFCYTEKCKQRIKTEEKARVNSVKQRTKTRSEVKMHNEKPIVCFPTAR